MEDDLRGKLLTEVEKSTNDPVLQEQARAVISTLIETLQQTPGVSAPEIEQTVIDTLDEPLKQADAVLRKAEIRLGLVRDGDF